MRSLKFQFLNHPLLRGIALILALSLVFSAPAFALRPTGLEESKSKIELQNALLNSSGLEENGSTRREWIGKLGITGLVALVFIWTGVLSFRDMVGRDTLPNPQFVISPHQQIGPLPVIQPSPKDLLRLSDTLAQQLAEDPGFFGWFAGVSDQEAAQTQQDMAFYIRYLEYRNQWLLQHLARTQGIKLSEEDQKEPIDPHYADYYRDQISSDPNRLERFKRTRSEIYLDIAAQPFPDAIDFEGKIGLDERAFPRSTLRLLNKLMEHKERYLSLEKKLATVPSDQKLSVVLSRLPVLFRMVQEGAISTETATAELKTALGLVGADRLSSYFSALIDWTALSRTERDPKKIRPVLKELAELLRADNFFLDPYLIARPQDEDPYWDSLVFKIVHVGKIGEKEVHFLQRIRGGLSRGQKITQAGYHHYALGDQKEISVVLMDQLWDTAQLVKSGIDDGSYAIVDWSDFAKSQRLQTGIARTLRQFVQQAELPSDRPSLWRLAVYNSALHEHTHALGNSSEYWTNLVELAVGHSGMQMPHLHSQIYDSDVPPHYKKASNQILDGLKDWRINPLEVDSVSQLRGGAGALLRREGRNLFDYFSLPAVQEDLKQLREDLEKIPPPRESLLNNLVQAISPKKSGAGLEEFFLESAVAWPEVRSGLLRKGWVAVPGGYLVETRQISSQEPLIMQTGLEEPGGLPASVPVIRTNETTVDGMLMFLLEQSGQNNFNVVFSTAYFDLAQARTAVPSSGLRPGSVLVRP